MPADTRARPAAAHDLSSPIARTLRRLDEREPALEIRAGRPTGPGWHRTADLLAEPASLADVVAAGTAALGHSHPAASPAVRQQVAAGLLLSHWSWAVGTAAVGCLRVDRRVPRLAHRDVWLRFDGGTVTGIALASATFWASAEDAGCGAVVTDDLGGALRRETAAHLSPLHDRLRGDQVRLRMGSRSLQAATVDGLNTASARLAGTDPPPRGSCCLWYRLPGEPECLTCPRRGTPPRRGNTAPTVRKD